jgi:tetratricopeptide (TPR) repeat protein
MMDNCKALKRKIGSSDLENYFSVSKNPKAQKLYSKGIKESEKENFRKAITYFQKALEVDSLFAFAWDNIGICNRRLENYDEAIYAYNKSLKLDPMGLMALQNIAVAYRYKKEYDKAIAAYERLAELDTKNPEVFYGIGLIYAFNLNDLEKGLDNMCKAYNLYIEQKSPYRTDAEKMIGYIYNDMKKQDKLEIFNQILQKYKIALNFE